MKIQLSQPPQAWNDKYGLSYFANVCVCVLVCACVCTERGPPYYLGSIFPTQQSTEAFSLFQISK